MNLNPNCDGGHCRHAKGVVRVLPTSIYPSGSNAILCETCHRYEMAWRKERNKELSADLAFPIVEWESLEIYKAGE